MKSQSSFYRGDARLQFTYVMALVLAVLALAWWILRREVALQETPSEAQAAHLAGQRCGFEFGYPRGWRVRDVGASGDESCAFTVGLPTSDSLGDRGTFTVSRHREPLDALARAFGFRRRQSGWVVLGRHDFDSRADTVSGAGWRGVYGIAGIGCRAGADSTYALCEVPRAVLDAGASRLVILGGVQSDEAVELFLKTLNVRSGR
jgi:hypothetical protein